MDSREKLHELMAKWRLLESQGKSTFEVKKLIQKVRLDNTKDFPFEVIIKISVAKNCCEECEKVKGMEMSLEEAYNLMPIPHPNCKRPGGCRCRLISVSKRDSNGILIKKQS